MDADSSSAEQVITLAKLNELSREIGSSLMFDEEAEQAMVHLTNDFIDKVLQGACVLAKHRNSQTCEVKDVQLYIEQSFNMWIPGYGTHELRPYKRAPVTDAHKQRVALIRRALKKH